MESPKSRFLKDELKAKEFCGLTKSDLFIKANDFALLEFIHQQPASPESAIAEAFRLQGAKRYRDILETLADLDAEPPKPKRGMNYEV